MFYRNAGRVHVHVHVCTSYWQRVSRILLLETEIQFRPPFYQILGLHVPHWRLGVDPAVVPFFWLCDKFKRSTVHPAIAELVAIRFRKFCC